MNILQNPLLPVFIAAVISPSEEDWQKALVTIPREAAEEHVETLEVVIKMLEKRLHEIKVTLSTEVEIPTGGTEDRLLDLYRKGFAEHGVPIEGDEAEDARKQFTFLKDNWNN